MRRRAGPGVPPKALPLRERSVNHVIGQGVSGLTFDQIARAGVRRISVGGSLARAAGGALMAICQEIAAGDFTALDSAPAWSILRSPKAVI